jgi:hypothetical protein
MFTDGQGPKIILGEVKGGFAETLDAGTIMIDNNSDIFNAALGKGPGGSELSFKGSNKIRYENVGSEGMARIMEHEPYHVLEKQNGIPPSKLQRFNKFQCRPNMAQGKKYEGGILHMKNLQDKLRIIRKWAR